MTIIPVSGGAFAAYDVVVGRGLLAQAGAQVRQARGQAVRDRGGRRRLGTGHRWHVGQLLERQQGRKDTAGRGTARDRALRAAAGV